MKILVTGGAGFIGSCLIRHIIENTSDFVVNLDKLTYAGNLSSVQSVSNSKRYSFHKIDICNYESVRAVFDEEQPDLVMHLAAESHVDRSIYGPRAFIETNIIGTFNLLEVTRTYLEKLTGDKKKNFRFHHISTDEVFGDLDEFAPPFTEKTPYAPSSPYSATKASSDHLVRSWGRTYNLPIVITNCSNNYGPFHFPEKLIPLTIINAIHGKRLPVYGKGDQIRDWLYVEDHAKALYLVASKGKINETYNIGGNSERRNIDVVRSICCILDELIQEKPKSIASFEELIEHVNDRPGHDTRYAIDNSKIYNELGWLPTYTFEQGLRKTVIWFLENYNWWQEILNKNQDS